MPITNTMNADHRVKDTYLFDFFFYQNIVVITA